MFVSPYGINKWLPNFLACKNLSSQLVKPVFSGKHYSLHDSFLHAALEFEFLDRTRISIRDTNFIFKSELVCSDSSSLFSHRKITTKSHVSTVDFTNHMQHPACKAHLATADFSLKLDLKFKQI